MNKFIFFVIIFSIFSCSYLEKSVLTIEIRHLSIDKLYVSIFGMSDGMIDTVDVINGIAELEFESITSNAYYISDSTGQIGINFVSDPGAYFAIWDNSNYTITGEKNIYINNLYNKVRDKMMEQSLLFSELEKELNIDSTKISQKIENNKADLIAIFHKAVLENRNNVVSALSLFHANFVVPIDKHKHIELFELIDSNIISNTILGNEIQEVYRINILKSSLPNIIPEVNILDRDKELIILKQLLNDRDYIYLDFWASWCIPCRAKIPELKKIFKKYSENIDFVSISIDENMDQWNKAIDDEMMPWRQFVVSDIYNYDKLKYHWGISSIPHGVMISKDKKTLGNDISNIFELQGVIAKIFEE